MSNKVSYMFIAQDLYTKVARKVSRATVGLQKQFKKLGNVARKSLAGIRKKVNETGKDLFRFGKIALAATAALTIKFGAGFQDAMADVSAITGAAGKDLQFFSDESLRLAKTSATAQSEVAGAFKAVASAKSELLKDPKGLSRVTEQVLLLKNASGIALPEAVQVGVGALNQFNVGADQAARFVNVLAAGSKVGASEVRDTGLALKEAATVAKQNAKLSFEELNSTIQVLAKSEIKGGKAGTALKNVLLGLETSGKKKIMPSIVGLNKALENLDKMNLNAKKSIKLFGREGITAAGILIQNRSTVAKWTKELTGTNSAQEQANKRMATFSTKARKLGIIIKGILIRVFLKLEPVLTKMADSMGRFFDSITDEDIDKFIEKLQDTVRVIKGIGAAIKEVFKTVGKFIGESTAKVTVFNEKLKTVTGAGLVGTAASAPIRALPGGSGAFKAISALFGAFTAPDIAAAPLGEKIDVGGTKTQTDINVNIRAPEGTVESVKSRTRGSGKNLNVGLNMVPAT